MNVTIEKFITGPIENNTYVVSSEAKAALVFDPSSGCGDVLAYCKKNSLQVKAVVITHAHFDHILGIPEIVKACTNVSVWVHPEERILLTNAEYNGSLMIGARFSYQGAVHDLAEGEMTIEGFTMRVLHVPGHSPGGCVFLFDNQCIAGDALFAGSIGRSDLPGGDGELLIRSIRGKLLVLPPETVVYPGHGNRTTIAREKRMNPFLQG